MANNKAIDEILSLVEEDIARAPKSPESSADIASPEERYMAMAPESPEASADITSPEGDSQAPAAEENLYSSAILDELGIDYYRGSFDDPDNTGEVDPTDRTMGEAISDFGASTAIGANIIVGIFGAAYGLATGDFDNTASRIAAQNIEFYNKRKSAGLLKSDEMFAMDLAEAEGFLDKAYTAFIGTVSNPQLLSSFIAEQLPMLLLTGGAGAVAGTAAKKALGVAVKTGAQVGAKTAGKVVASSKVAGAVGSGAVMHGASAGEEAVKNFEKTIAENPGLLPVTDQYIELLNSGLSEEEARAEIGLHMARSTAFSAAAISVMTQFLPGARILEKSLVGVKLKPAAIGKGAVGKAGTIAKAMFGETASEATEEATGVLFGNLSVKYVDKSKDVFEGVGEATGQGAAGGIFGLPAGVVQTLKVTDDDTKDFKKNKKKGSAGKDLTTTETTRQGEPEDAGTDTEVSGRLDQDAKEGVIVDEEPSADADAGETVADGPQDGNIIDGDFEVASDREDLGETKELPEPEEQTEQPSQVEGEAEAEGQVENEVEVEEDFLEKESDKDLDEADAEYIERRKRNRRVLEEEFDSMSEEDKFNTIFMNELTGIPNRRAFNRYVDDAPVVASIDADSLKTINDALGPQAGDQLLQHIATALNKKFEGAAYHISGDEFYVLSDSQAEIDSMLKEVLEELSGVEITKEKDGGSISVKGLKFTYGIGPNREVADERLKSEKEAAEKAGNRASRGMMPKNSSVTMDDGTVYDLEGQEALEIFDKVKKGAIKANNFLQKNLLGEANEDTDGALVNDSTEYMENITKEALDTSDIDQSIDEYMSELGDILREESGIISATEVQETSETEGQQDVTDSDLQGEPTNDDRVSEGPNEVAGEVSEDRNGLSGDQGRPRTAEQQGRGSVNQDEGLQLQEVTEEVDSPKPTPAKSRGSSDKNAEFDEEIESRNSSKLEGFTTYDALPDDIYDKVEEIEESTNGKVRAIYDSSSDKIYVIYENIKDVGELNRVIAHEVVHAGLMNKYGSFKELHNHLDSLYEAIGGEQQLDAIAEEAGINLDKYKILYDQESYRNAALISELAAHMAEGEHSSSVKSIMAAVRKLMAKFGVDLTSKVNEDSKKALERIIKEANQSFFEHKMEGAGDTDNIAFASLAPSVTGVYDVDSTKDKIRKAAKKVKEVYKRNFVTSGNLPKEAFDLKLSVDAERNIDEQVTKAMSRKLTKLINKTYSKANRKAARIQVNEALLGDLKSLRSLPSEVQKHVGDMRLYVDNLSVRMLKLVDDDLRRQIFNLSIKKPKLDIEVEIRNFAAGKANNLTKPIRAKLRLRQTIKNNMGEYLHRSFRAFDDPKWVDTVRDTKVFRDAVDYVIKSNNNKISHDDAEGQILQMLEHAKDTGNVLDFMAADGVFGGKNNSVLKKRKKIPEELLDVLGVYVDPNINFLKTSNSMTKYLAHNEYLNNMRMVGLQMGFLKEKPTTRGDDYTIEVASKKNRAFDPIAGLYTTRAGRDTLKDYEGDVYMGVVLAPFIRAASAVKYGKTILDQAVHVGNFASNILLLTANGHVVPSKMVTAFQDTIIKSIKGDVELDSYLEELISIGVIHDSARSGEMRDMVKDIQGGADPDVVLSKLKQGIRRAGEYVENLYQAEDDFFKIVGYEAEKKAKIKAGMTPEEASKVAAYRVRNGYPTYSTIPRAIRTVRRVPIVGSFPSFTYEMLRVSANQFKFLAEDYKTDRASFYRRSVGMAVSYSIIGATAAISKALLGIGDEEDEAVRAMGPRWSRNARFVYLGYDENGDPQYIDLSRFDPYNNIKSTLRALTNDNNRGVWAKGSDAAWTLLEPYFGLDIMAANLYETITNDRLGSRSTVRKDGTSLYQQAKDTFENSWNDLAPGGVRRAVDIFRAGSGDVTYYGKKADLADSLYNFFGLRTSTLDVDFSYRFKVSEFSSGVRYSTAIMSRMLSDQREYDREEIEKTVNDFIRSYEENFDVLRDTTLGAQRLGLSKKDITERMVNAGVKNHIGAILKGKQPKWYPTSRFGQKALKSALITANTKEEKDEIKRIYKEKFKTVMELLKDYYRNAS